MLQKKKVSYIIQKQKAKQNKTKQTKKKQKKQTNNKKTNNNKNNIKKTNNKQQFISNFVTCIRNTKHDKIMLSKQTS